MLHASEGSQHYSLGHCLTKYQTVGDTQLIFYRRKFRKKFRKSLLPHTRRKWVNKAYKFIWKFLHIPLLERFNRRKKTWRSSDFDSKDTKSSNHYTRSQGVRAVWRGVEQGGAGRAEAGVWRKSEAKEENCSNNPVVTNPRPDQVAVPPPNGRFHLCSCVWDSSLLCGWIPLSTAWRLEMLGLSWARLVQIYQGWL